MPAFDRDDNFSRDDSCDDDLHSAPDASHTEEQPAAEGLLPQHPGPPAPGAPGAPNVRAEELAFASITQHNHKCSCLQPFPPEILNALVQVFCSLTQEQRMANVQTMLLVTTAAKSQTRGSARGNVSIGSAKPRKPPKRRRRCRRRLQSLHKKQYQHLRMQMQAQETRCLFT